MRTLPDRRAARRDPRPQRPRARAQRARHEPRGLARRPAEEPRGAAARAAPARDGRRPPREASSRRASASTRDDPLTPVVIRRGIHDDQISYVKEHQLQFPGVQLADSYLRKYPHRSLAAHVLGHVGEISADGAEGDEAGRLQARATSIGQAGVEATYDTYLRGRDGSQQLHGRLARPADERGRDDGEPAAGQHAAAHDRHQPPAGRRAGAARRHRRSRTTNGGAGRRTAARSSRSTRATARCSRSPRTRPSSRRSTSAATRASSRRSRTTQSPREKNHPGLNRALDVTYPPGSTWKPVTALAAMQEHILTPYSSLPCTPSYTAYDQMFNNWNPYANGWIDAADGARRVVRHLLLPGRPRLLRAAREPRPPAPELGLALRLRRADRHRHRPRGARPRADARVAARDVQRAAVRRDRPHLEAGLLDPDGDRPGRPRRDAAPDDALLRDARERRPARHAAHRRGRRAADERPAHAAGAAPLHRAAADAERRRPGRALDRPHRPLRGDALADRHLVRRLRLVPGLDLRQDRHRREARHAARLFERASSSTSRGGAATGRPRTRRSSSAP